MSKVLREAIMRKSKATSFIHLSVLTLCFAVGSSANVCSEWFSGAVYAGNGVCYWLNPERANFTNAQFLCENKFRGRLAEPRSTYQFQTAKTLISDANVVYAFLGATDHGNGGDWTWLDGNLLQVPSTWWGSKQPDNPNDFKNCLAVHGTRLWDELCSSLYTSICQKHLGNPCNQVLPGAEYYNGQCFLAMSDQTHTLDQAQGRCEQAGAYLTEPNTAELLAFVNMFAGMSFGLSQNVVIGLTLTPPDSLFRWQSTGYPVTLSNWPFQSFLFADGDPVGTPGETGRVAVHMVQTMNWMWAKLNSTYQAYAICQKVIPVYSHAYLAALSDSALSVTESILLVANHAHSQPGWVTVELTYNHASDVDEENFLGQKGFQLQHALIQDSVVRSLMMRSTQPLIVTLTLWKHDLTAISSTLLLPIVTSGVSESRLVYTSPGKGSMSVQSVGTSTVHLQVALSGGEEADATFSVGELHYLVRSWVNFNASLTNRSRNLYVHSVSGFSKSPLVYSSTPITLLASEERPPTFGQFNTLDIAFENVLSTSQVGMNYVTFPSMPLTYSTMDTFTVVAVYDDTLVKVPHPDLNLGSYDVILEEAGDTLNFELRAIGFRHVTGSKPFYLYARLGGTGGNNSCTVTLLSDHLWTGHYTVHMGEPWTMLQYVYIIVVGEGEELEYISVKTADGIDVNLAKNCQEVQETNYTACSLRLPATTEAYSLSRPMDKKFAAYIFGGKGQAAACHQLGIGLTAASGGFDLMQFDAHAYIESMREDVPEPCPEQPNGTTENTAGFPGDTTTEVNTGTSTEDTTSTAETPTATTDVADGISSSESLSTSDLQTTLETTAAEVASQLPPCGYNKPNLTLSSEDFQDLLENINEFLRVDSMNTSQARRKKESAQDHRVSSVSLGLFSCSIIFLVVSMLFFSDVASVLAVFVDCMRE